MENTIIAIATSCGSASGISIIRMSGEKSLSIIDKVFKGKDSPLSKCPSHTIHYGHIYDGNKLIDEVLVSIFLSPRSYTTEDTVEINCHGGILNTKIILELLINNGAILAAPGEFTKRAFLNGRIDLSKAEAISDIIHSENTYALNNAIYQLSGRLSNKINIIREDILNGTAAIEAALDDPEHYDIDDILPTVKITIENSIKKIEKFINSYENGRIISEGINTVILGKPNVGKSSLLNYLSGYESAIVTDIAGTTRDVIKEKINLDGLSLNIIDTAGIRTTTDKIEKIGIDRSLSQVKIADLILAIFDSSNLLNDDDMKIFDIINKKNSIVLLNKTDLKILTSSEMIKNFTSKPIIEISIKCEKGLNELKNMIHLLFIKDIKIEESGNIITSLRQKSCLQKALNSLKNCLKIFEDGMPCDLILVDMMDVYTALGEILGKIVNEDLIDKIFSNFCMGK